VLGLLYTGYFGGREQVLLSLKMTGIVMAALFFLYVMKGLGGGDIKLFGMLAAFYPEEIFGIVVLSFFLGAGFALFRMVVRVLRREAVYQRGETLHFSIPIAMAAMVLPVLP
jgi:Flp pilus assembly protein protease CpaA